MGFVNSDPITPPLLALVRTGDRDAFGVLFRSWYERLADYAFRVCGNRDAAEDVVQDVMIGVWQRRDALPDAAALPAYLHRAVRNRALNQIRDAKTGERAFARPELDPGQAPAADAHVLQKELSESIDRALGDLPPRTREVFQLSREQNLTYQQIATTLEISVKTVETLMGRALKSLREQLKPK